MRDWGRAAIAAAMVVFAAVTMSSANAQGVSHPPPEAFARLPFMRDLRLSPDGKYMSVLQDVEGQTALVIYQVGARTKPALFSPPNWFVEHAVWAKNDRIVVYLSQNEILGQAYASSGKLVPLGRAVSLSPAGDDMQVLFKGVTYSGNNLQVRGIDDRDLDDPDHVYIPLAVSNNDYSPAELATRLKNGLDAQNPFRLDMYRVSLRDGSADVVENGSTSTRYWQMDGHGHVVARVDETENPLLDHLKAYDKGSWRDVGGAFDATGDNGAAVAALTEDGTGLVRYERRSGGTIALSAINLSTGAETKLFDNPDYDVSQALVDEWTGRVIGAYYVDDRERYTYFDADRAAIDRGLAQAFPSVDAYTESVDLARDRVIVGTESSRQPPTYYFLDRGTHQASLIGSAYPELHEADLGEMKSYPYKARDGLPIAAYLTLPPGREAKNLPLVVMPHGGPNSRDYIRFDWWAQFMANRGYAVLQPNFRGSFGYGDKFTQAGLHQWGLKMQDDVTDGVKKAIADGIADPKRVCIVGASYGGYAALAGATFTPDLYACAISFAGVSDLPTMLFDVHASNSARLSSFWESRIGQSTTDAQLHETSPALHAALVKCPVLLMHGNDDTTVAVKQSLIEEAALKAAGKNVRMIRIDGDDHYMERSATRLRVLQETEAFLAANIGR